MQFCVFLLHKLLKMMESYRAHYLLTSLAVVKRTCLTMTDMWVLVPVLQSSRREYSYNMQEGRQFIKTTNSKGYIETQIHTELEMRRNRNSNLKQSMLILCNNYNMQFVHLSSSCANL